MSVFISQNNALSNSGHTGIVDLRQGGQQGLKRDADFWFHNSLYVKQPIITVMMAAPKGFRWLPDGDKIAAMLKSMVELHAISVTGLNQSYTNEYDEKVVGASNEVMQTHLRTGRERSTPTFSIPELDGKPVTRLLKYWNDYLLSDPESGVPAIAGVQAYIDAGSPHLTPEDKAMTCMFIEPTHNRKNVNSVYMCANMMPDNIPDEISSEKGAAGESPLMEIPFTSLTTVRNLDDIAQAYLNSLNKGAYLPDALGRMANEIDPNVADEAAPGGYRTGVDSAANALA